MVFVAVVREERSCAGSMEAVPDLLHWPRFIRRASEGRIMLLAIFFIAAPFCGPLLLKHVPCHFSEHLSFLG